MLAEIESHIQAKRNFAFETTLSGRGYLRLIRRLRDAGWRVELSFLALPSLQVSFLRVAHGGHDVPLQALQRRFPRSIKLLLNDYAPAVDHTLCNMNAGATPEPVFSQTEKVRTIINPELYANLLDHAR